MELLPLVEETIEAVEILAGWCVLLGIGVFVVGLISTAALVLGVVAVCRRR